MFRNQYDTDCTTWSPAGRIHQIEYALEAVKQGSAAIGLRSNKYAIVATLKRASSELSSHQKKIFKIDDHVGIAIAGLVADARVLAKYMRTECINHRYTYDEPMQAPVSTLPQIRSPAPPPPFCLATLSAPRPHLRFFRALAGQPALPQGGGQVTDWHDPRRPPPLRHRLAHRGCRPLGPASLRDAALRPVL